MEKKKLERTGSFAVEIHELQIDLGDIAEGLEDDKQFFVRFGQEFCRSGQELRAETGIA